MLSAQRYGNAKYRSGERDEDKLRDAPAESRPRSILEFDEREEELDSMGAAPNIPSESSGKGLYRNVRGFNSMKRLTKKINTGTS